MEKARIHIAAQTREHVTADLNAALDYLVECGFDPERIGSVGFCMGGTLSYVAATLRAYGAAVTFYGGGMVVGRFGFPGLIELAAEIKTPWLGLFGDLDPIFPLMNSNSCASRHAMR